MAKSVPEALTVGLAGVLDVLGVGRRLGLPFRDVLAGRLFTADERRRVEALPDDSPADEAPEVQRGPAARSLWEALAWAWFVIGAVVIASCKVLGNSPLRPGWPTVAFAAATLVAGAALGNWVVCLGIGRGRTFLGRPGGGNLVWLMTASLFWAWWIATALFPG